MATTIASLRHEERQTLVHEERVVWLVDPSELPRYVREIFVPTGDRRDEPPFRGKLVAYAILRPDAPGVGGFGKLTEKIRGKDSTFRAGGRNLAAAPGPDADWPYG